jgi:hypothetical protein
MNNPEPSSKKKRPVDGSAGGSTDPLTDDQMIEFAAVLDDFMDEEVVDERDAVIGTLACYWQSVSGELVFLGIKLERHEAIRVVPARRSQVDGKHSCIRLGFDARDIESAPQFDCASDLDAALERMVYEHFRIDEPQPQGGLRYVARRS